MSTPFSAVADAAPASGARMPGAVGPVGSDAEHHKPVSPDALNGTIEFNEDRPTLAMMILTNTIATFCTFGLFRFWARTRLRQFFWHQTVLAGSTFEYHGRGIELFTGFCLIFGALGACFFAFYVTSVQVFTSESADAVFSYLPFGLLPLLLPIAFYRARGYRLCRSIWRGIHLSQDGSSLTYMAIWLGGLLATVFTLGLAYPWRNVWTAKYRVNHTLFGRQRVSFDGKGRDLMIAWLPAWVCSVFLMAALIGGGIWLSLYDTVTDLGTDMNAVPVGGPWSDFYAIPPALWGLALACSTILFFFAFVHYRVSEFRYFASKTALGEARFSSNLETGQVLNIITPGVLGQLGYAVGSGGAVALLFTLLADLPRKVVNGGEPLLITLAASLLALGLLFVASFGISHVLNVRIRAPLMVAIGRSLTIHNPEALNAIEQADRLRSEDEAIKPQEGLAEAYEFGDF